MKIQRLFPCCLCLLLVFTSGCQKEEKETPKNEFKVTILDPTDIGETSFRANWIIEGSGVESILIQVSTTSDFKDISAEVHANDPGVSSQVVEGLHGATHYYYRLLCQMKESSDVTSDQKPVDTGFQSEGSDVTTSDGLKIAGDLYYLSTNPPKCPAVILMGHFSISNMWKGENLFRDLVAAGYVCYIFNYRGHGASDSWPIAQITTLEALEEFITEYVAKDLEACYNHLREHPLVDPTRIGLMGGSLGANMSMFANNWPGVIASVGLTTSRLGLDVAGILSNVLFIASDLDCNQFICYDEEAWYMHDNAADPRKVIIIPGDYHGLDMLVEPSLKGQILEWIDARMGI